MAVMKGWVAVMEWWVDQVMEMVDGGDEVVGGGDEPRKICHGGLSIERVTPVI